MLHHHLSQLIWQVASLDRHVVGLCCAAIRIVSVALDRLELPRNTRRAGFRTICPRRKCELKNQAIIRRPLPLLSLSFRLALWK